MSAQRTVDWMLRRRVTQVALIRTAEDGDEQWRVEWTETVKLKTEQLVKYHFTESAARRHANDLLKHRASGLSVDAIYREQR